MDYDQRLDEMFSDLVINLVSHDTSAHGLPATIVVSLPKMPKDKGQTALDLSNYLSRRFGLRFQSCPEYRGRGKSTTIRYFMSWQDIEPIRANIIKACEKPESMIRHEFYLPYEFRSLIIQDKSRGVTPRCA